MPKAKEKAAPKKRPARKRGSVAAKAQPAPAPATVTGNYEVTETLSIPMVKLNHGDRYALTVQSVRLQMLPKTKYKTAATLLRCVNLDTGELGDYIAPKVLKSVMTRAYGELPEHDEEGKEPQHFDATSWDGKSILIECDRPEGERYMNVNVRAIKPK